jgi:hypothetical protein
MKFALGRVVLIPTLFIVACGVTRLQAEPPSMPGEVVKLPPLIVEEKLPPLHWRYASLPGREVLSLCDAGSTERFMQRDWQLEQWLHRLLPDRFRVQLAVAEGQILFNESTGRANAREIVAEMARRDGATLDADGTITTPGAESASFGPSPRRVQILPNMRLTDRDVVRVFAILTDEASDDFVFARDRVAFLLARRTPALPAWFIEGFVKLYEGTHFYPEEFVFLPVTWTSAALTDALARNREQPRVLLPMDELFSRSPTTRKGDDEDEKIWHAQAASFVRWALADGNEVRREQFWRWLDRLDQAPADEPAFRACFGFGYADARDRLSDFLREAVGRKEKRPTKKIGQPPSVDVRTATDLEIARLRGDWERLQASYVRARYPDLAKRYSAQARRTLLRAYDRGERDPQLLAVIGLLECDEDKAAAGRTFLEAAAQQHTFRPRVGFELARLRFREFENGDHAHRFTKAETEAILGPLMPATRQSPPLPEIYALIEAVWLRSAIQPGRDDLAALREGVRNFPEATGLVIGAVQLYVNAGAVTEARALAERGRLFAADTKSRERVDQISRELAAVSAGSRAPRGDPILNRAPKN